MKNPFKQTTEINVKAAQIESKFMRFLEIEDESWILHLRRDGQGKQVKCQCVGEINYLKHMCPPGKEFPFALKGKQDCRKDSIENETSVHVQHTT